MNFNLESFVLGFGVLGITVALLILTLTLYGMANNDYEFTTIDTLTCLEVNGNIVSCDWSGYQK